eukprot:GHRQ01022843.1.p1 GENE.GHRQ01022843.1~~GHRQ01022843.1.p1  ORF type:complete len:158 (-),score=56.07 GHRQ01022843.1:207-680(-)
MYLQGTSASVATAGCLMAGLVMAPAVCACCCLQNHPGKGVTAQLPESGLSGGGATSIFTIGSKLASQQQLHTQANGSSKKGGGSLRVALGNRLLMQEQGVVLGSEVEDYMQLREAQGQTCVLVGVNGTAVAALAISDPLKPEAAGVVAALQRQVSQG